MSSEEQNNKRRPNTLPTLPQGVKKIYRQRYSSSLHFATAHRLLGRLAASRAKDREKSRVKGEDEREPDDATPIKQQGEKKEEYTRRKRHYTRTYTHTRRSRRTYINYISQIYIRVCTVGIKAPKNFPGERDDNAVFWSAFYAVGHLDNDVVTEQLNRRILQAEPFHTFISSA